MNYIITSYVTPAYVPIADQYLKRSLRETGFPNHIAMLTDRGNWQSNTLFKAQFIKNMMTKYPDRGIVFVDADAVIHSEPVLFDRLYDDGIDFAAHRRTWRRGRIKNEMLSGTLYFGPTDAAHILVNAWIDENRAHPTKLEQRNLESACNKVLEYPLVWEWLPVEYCTVFDGDDRPRDPVIEHFQASRKMRRKR